MIVASRYEASGRAALEAMAYGGPLVATGTGGLTEIVDDGRAGLLAEPGDPADLAAAVLRFLDAPRLAVQFGESAARDAVSRFHLDSFARQTADFCRALLDRRNSL